MLVVLLSAYSKKNTEKNHICETRRLEVFIFFVFNNPYMNSANHGPVDQMGHSHEFHLRVGNILKYLSLKQQKTKPCMFSM